MTQKQIKQTIYSSLHCDMNTAAYCLKSINDNAPDNIRKAESINARYYQYPDGSKNTGIVLIHTKFNDDPQPWFFAIYLD